MNLFALSGNAIAVVNPRRTATVKRSAGYSVAEDGSQVPAYRIYYNVPVQVQALSNDELHQIEGMNIQGNKCAAYVAGDYVGIVRLYGAGGDIFTIDNQIWLVVTVLENWGPPGDVDGWVKLALTNQLA